MGERLYRIRIPGKNGNVYLGVSKKKGTPKSSILIGFSIINHPFWGIPIFWKHPYTGDDKSSVEKDPISFCKITSVAGVVGHSL